MIHELRARRALSACVLAAALLVGSPMASSAHAQSDPRRERLYLTSLSLVLDGARRLVGFCESNAGDAEFARFARPLAERYVELANRMLPTPKAVVVHPHLLLVVENLEGALDAAAASDSGGYQKRLRIAREELLNLEAVLRQLKLRLPEAAR